MPTDTEYPPDVIALAMLQAAADGDWASVARLREMGGGEEPETFAWSEDTHPRDDHGRFVSAGEIRAASRDPKKAEKLRESVTKPDQREKLDKAIRSVKVPGKRGLEWDAELKGTVRTPEFHNEEGYQFSNQFRGALIHAIKRGDREAIDALDRRAERTNRIHWTEAESKALHQIEADYLPTEADLKRIDRHAADVQAAFEQARETVKDAYHDWAIYAREMLEDGADHEPGEKARDAFDKAYDDVREAYKQGQNTVWDAIEKARDALGGKEKGYKLGRYFFSADEDDEESLFSEFFAADAPPGTHPPFPGAQYDKQIHHWVKPDTGEATHDHEGKPVTPGSAPHAPKAGAGETAKPAAVSPPPPDLNKPQPGEVGAAPNPSSTSAAQPQSPGQVADPATVDHGHGPGFDASGAKIGTRATNKGFARTRDRKVGKDFTNEGVRKDMAKSLTPEQIRAALSLHDGMTIDPSLKGPNKRLPDATRPELNDFEAGCLQKYTYLNDRILNGQLRGRPALDKETGKPLDPTYAEDFYKQMNEGMQEAFKKAPVMSKPVTVVRGMNFENPEHLQTFLAPYLEAHKTGASVGAEGYVSTATTGGLFQKLGLADPTSSIPGAFRGGNVHFKINAVHGLDMQPYTQLTNEREFLLNHGSRYKVKSVTLKNGRYTLELDQMPPTNTPQQPTTHSAEVPQEQEADAPISPETLQFYKDHPEAVERWTDPIQMKVVKE